MNKTLKYSLIAFAVLLVFAFIASKAGWIGKKEGIEVEVEKAALRTLVETVAASGKIQPETEVKLSPEVSGEIIELNIKEGDYVEKGRLLLRINPDIYQANVSRTEAAVNTARAGLAQAQAQFVEAQKSFTRNKGLFEKGVISTAEFEIIQRTYDVAKLGVESASFQLKSAEASAKETRDNLRRTTLYAPNSGTVSKLAVELGERVVGTAQMAGTELLRIANLEKMQVVVDVNENDIVRVSLNDTAIIEVDAYPGKTFKGVVTEIANSAKSELGGTDQVTNFQVRIAILKSSYEDLIDLKKGPSPFRPGMTAAVDIRTAYRTNVVTVPIQAVTLRKPKSEENDTTTVSNDDKLEVVFLEQDGKAVMQTVKTGIQDLNHIEIVSGIADGAEVISGPYGTVSRTLKDGQKTKVIKKDSGNTK